MGTFHLTVEGMHTWKLQTHASLAAAVEDATRRVRPIQTAMRAMSGQSTYVTKFYLTACRPLPQDGDPGISVGMMDVVWSNNSQHEVTFDGLEFNLSQLELEHV